MNKENTVKKNKATKCKMCGKRRVCDDMGLCKMECAKEMAEQAMQDAEAVKAAEMEAIEEVKAKQVEEQRASCDDPIITEETGDCTRCNGTGIYPKPSGIYLNKKDQPICMRCNGSKMEPEPRDPRPTPSGDFSEDKEANVGIQEVLDEEAKAEREANEQEKKYVRKVLALITLLRDTLAHMKEKNEFIKLIKAENNPKGKALLEKLEASHKALLEEARFEAALFNKCTKRKVEVVVVSDPHSSGWTVEMQLPNVTDHLALRTFRYKQVLDVKAKAEAVRVKNAAAWKYFTAEEVGDTHWTEL